MSTDNKLVLDMMEKLSDKMEKQGESLHSIDKTLSVQAEQLKDHIRRTEILEDKVEPLETHKDRIQGALKLLSILGTVVAIAWGVYKFIVV